MFRYTIQKCADSGNWAHPEGTEVFHCRTKDWVNSLFEVWAETVGRFNDERDAYIMVWCGELYDITDQYPDFRVSYGLRMGIRWERC
jgi:hypothetical protein